MNDLNRDCPPPSDLDTADREAPLTRRAFVKRSSFATVASTAVYAGLIKTAAGGPPGTTTGPSTTVPHYRITCGGPENGEDGDEYSDGILLEVPVSGGETLSRTIRAVTPSSNVDSSSAPGNVPAVRIPYSLKPRFHDGTDFDDPGETTGFAAELDPDTQANIGNEKKSMIRHLQSFKILISGERDSNLSSNWWKLCLPLG